MSWAKYRRRMRLLGWRRASGAEARDLLLHKRVVRLQFQRALLRRDRILNLARAEVCFTERIEKRRVLRLRFDGFAGQFHGLLEPLIDAGAQPCEVVLHAGLLIIGRGVEAGAG